MKFIKVEKPFFQAFVAFPRIWRSWNSPCVFVSSNLAIAVVGYSVEALDGIQRWERSVSPDMLDSGLRYRPE